MHKNRILIIPTYFPTRNAPIVGTQVKEQTEFLIEYFDIKVIYCLPGMGWKRFFIFLLFGWVLKNKGYRRCDNILQSGKLDAAGVYYFNSKILPQRINKYFQKKAYDFSFKSLFQNWIPDLIHARGASSAGVIANYISSNNNIPYILTENTAYLLNDIKSIKEIKTYQKTLNEAKAILFVSNFIKQLTIMNGVGLNSRHYIIGNGINDKEFNIKKKENNNGKFIIATTGYSSYIKDYDTFFKAIRYIVNKGYKNIEVKIGITYNDNKEIEKKALQYDVHKYCSFHTQIERKDMPNFYKNVDVYVQTSIIETFGIATAESMFCGTPVISTNNGGINDFITNKNGIICRIGNFKDIGNALIDIITGVVNFHPGEVRNSVLHKYREETFLRRLKNIYQEILLDAK